MAYRSACSCRQMGGRSGVVSHVWTMVMWRLSWWVVLQGVCTVDLELWWVNVGFVFGVGDGGSGFAWSRCGDGAVGCIARVIEVVWSCSI